MARFQRTPPAAGAAARDRQSMDRGAVQEAMRLIEQGNACEDEARTAEALHCYERAIRLAPNLARAHLNRGNALATIGDLQAAVHAFEAALAQDPEYAAAHFNMGNAFVHMGKREAALDAYRNALSLKPDFAGAEVALGGVLEDLGRYEDAAGSYSRALAIEPDYVGAHCNLGNALQALGRYDDAAASYRRALAIDPDSADAHYNLGNVLTDLRQLEEAVASYRRAVEIKSDFVDAHCSLGSALQDLGQHDAALESYQRALALDAGHALAHLNLGNLWMELSKIDNARASYLQALASNPDLAVAHDNLLFCMSHMDAISAVDIFAEHGGFGAHFEAPLLPTWPEHRNSRDPDRCLKVGFVSGDLRNHAMSYFIEPLIVSLSNSHAITLHAYYTHVGEDAVTSHLRAQFRSWQSVAHLSDAALAQKIGDDGIDILIDLSGHTRGNRLLCFARKPAPVQASWLGYLGTTGLRAMDYYFADRYFLPAAEFQDLFTERLAYLPAIVAFLPDPGAPDVGPLPAFRNGYLTFGSFNRLNKLTPSCISLWSRLLRAVPDSRILLAAMPIDGNYSDLIDEFGNAGIAPERLVFHSRCATPAYLALHNTVDICLDTVPYTGGATTCHALWMGVPTLCLAGNTIPGRLSAAMLRHVELDEFVADDAADFERKGLCWAHDLAALATVRAGLRARFRRSLIGQPKRVAVGFEHALRAMWQRWCAGLPATMLELGEFSGNAGLPDTHTNLASASKDPS
jgi:protein O-GlcNAc transferase